MKIRVGYEIIFECPQPTPMILTLSIHHTRASDIIIPDAMTTNPAVPMSDYRDGYGNRCTRIVAPAGPIRIASTGVVNDTGKPDQIVPAAHQHLVKDLPDETLVFLLGSRYCETDQLSQAAWDLFGQNPRGWGRVQAICDFVHNHITFSHKHASAIKGAAQVFKDQKKGVCRDYAHLAIAFCRCMNIPARYCTGYISDLAMPPPYETMDFAAWFEAYLDGQWHAFDPRNNIPQIGRVLIARGRDAADVPISNTFGPSTLTTFKVFAEEETTAA